MIKKSKITAAVMAAILAVTTIFSPVLAGEFSSPEEITEEFSDGQESQDYKNEISDDMPQIQNEDGEGVSATESETETVVETEDEFERAANNPSVKIIRIKGNIGNHEKEICQLPNKKIIIDSGSRFKITSSSHSIVYTTNIEICDKAYLYIDSKNQDGQIWLQGNINNKGNIKAVGSGDVYVNYQENLGKINEKLKINILQDEIQVSIPPKVTAGETIKPNITGMILDSENKASEIFKVKWEPNENPLTEETGISYKVPVNTDESKIKLKLILNEQYGAVKQNDVQNPNNFNVQTRTFQSNECTIEKKTLDTIYVDNKKGNDEYTGASETTPVKTFLRALRGIKNGGTIILLSNCVTNAANFDKTVTVTGKSNGSSLTLPRCFIDPNITVTLNNISIETDDISLYEHSGKSGEPGNLVLNAVNANIKKINGLSVVTLNNSKIACPTIEADTVELSNTELNGQFSAHNLTINGENTLIYTLNSPGKIDQGITGTGKLKVRLNLNDIEQNKLRGIKVLEVPEVPEAMSEISNIELDSSYGKQYKLKIRKDDNGNYMYISEGIDPQIDLYVGNEPRDKENISVNVEMTNFSDVPMSVVGNWSGYKGNAVWSYGDIPVLTVTVTLPDSENYHFNQVQDLTNLIKVYSRKDTNTAINKDVESKATVTVEENKQGISEDGRYCTFTLTYPKVKHIASILISGDSLDKVYDGNAVAPPAIITVPEKVQASLKWYQKNGEDWTEIGAAPTDAGKYSVMACAEESEDYEAGYSERVEFTISKAQNIWTVNPAINNWTSDQTPSEPAGKAKFGTVSFSYSDKEDGTYTETQPTSSGSWYMKATVAETDNYDGLEKIIPFTIYTPYYPPIVIPTATPTPSPTPTVKPVPDNYPDGSEYLPDGSIKTPNGTIVDSDGKITLPNGVIVKPGHEENKPTLNKENEVITGDGTLVIRPGLSELETGAGWKIFSDGRIVDTDGNVYAMDGSVSDKDGNCMKPAKAMIKNAYTYKNKNQVKVVLYDSCKGAQGYDYVIGKSSNMLQTKEYEKVNKNRKGLKTTFTYMDKGTWYVACHAWVKDANGKKTFGEWSEVKTVVVNAKTPSQPRIISVKTNGSTVTVKFSKTGKATGAEVVLGKELEKLYGEKRPVEYKRYVIEEDEDVTTVTFKNVKKGTYYLSLRKWNRTADNNEKVFGPWAEYVKANVK